MKLCFDRTLLLLSCRDSVNFNTFAYRLSVIFVVNVSTIFPVFFQYVNMLTGILNLKSSYTVSEVSPVGEVPPVYD